MRNFYEKELSWGYFSSTCSVTSDFTLEEVADFLKSRKRFLTEGRVSVPQEYCIFDFDFLPRGRKSKMYFTDIPEDIGKTYNGGDYLRYYRDFTIYKDSEIKIYRRKYFTSYDGGCCPECGNYGELDCCQPTIHAKRLK